MREDLSQLASIQKIWSFEDDPVSSSFCEVAVDAVVDKGADVVVDCAEDVGAGDYKGDLGGEVRGTVDHQTPLDDGLLDQVELLDSGGQRGKAKVEHLLQISDSSVDQFSRLRTGPCPEVIPVDQQSSQASGGGIQEDADSVATAADDQYVILVVVLYFLDVLFPSLEDRSCPLLLGVLSLADNLVGDCCDG